MTTRKEQGRADRGFFGIGIERGKTTTNLGTLWRSAVCMDASFIFTVGARYHPQASDTVKSWRHVPYFKYADVADFRAHIPHDVVPVGVELTADAQPLETFPHPPRAVYLLGPEDGSLSGAALELCASVVKIDTRWCLNVAAAGSVLMYDRRQKAALAKRAKQGWIAQLGEHPLETRERVGSIPAPATNGAH